MLKFLVNLFRKTPVEAPTTQPYTYSFTYGSNAAPVLNLSTATFGDQIIPAANLQIVTRQEFDGLNKGFTDLAHIVVGHPLDPAIPSLKSQLKKLAGTLDNVKQVVLHDHTDRISELESAVNGSGEVCSLATVRSAIWGEGQLLNRLAAIERTLAKNNPFTAPLDAVRDLAFEQLDKPTQSPASDFATGQYKIVGDVVNIPVPMEKPAPKRITPSQLREFFMIGDNHRLHHLQVVSDRINAHFLGEEKK